MLKYLAADQPGAVLDAMCAGPADGQGLLRRPGHRAALAAARPAPGIANEAGALKTVGKGV